jgi:ATP-dependent protease HslVU (ClpYQ) peptidase subunit
MTTVAWRGEVLAADSALTCGNMQGKFTKILRKRGVAYGFCGDADAVHTVMGLLSGGAHHAELKRLKADLGILILTPEGCFLSDQDMQPLKLENEFWAIGSGAEYAMGAMAAGKSAAQAVEIACQFDPHSNGPVVTHKVRRKRV